MRQNVPRLYVRAVARGAFGQRTPGTDTTTIGPPEPSGRGEILP